jgi:hypothetical protein
MIRRLRSLLIAAVLLPGPLLPSGDAIAQNSQVDVELVLAVDISYSMDYEELSLQREGYILAISSEQFLDAMRRGPIGKIAVA